MSSQSLEGLRLLVIDDDPDTRTLLTILFELYGAKVVTAASAVDGLQTMSFFQPDVLISDICLPGEDGYSLIQKIRNLDFEQGGRIPAIALTACNREEIREHAYLAGFQKYLSKPIDLDELTSMVASLAEQPCV